MRAAFWRVEIEITETRVLVVMQLEGAETILPPLV